MQPRILFFLSIIILSSCGEGGLLSDKLPSQDFYCDMENLSPDDPKRILTDNGNFPLPKSNGRTDEMARSGKYSVKCFAKNQFALEIKLYDIRANEFFELSIWKSPGTESGKLAVEGEDLLIYEEEVAETDSLGWQKIVMRFIAHPEIIGEELKFYFWNHTDEVVYLDDFRLVNIGMDLVQYDEDIFRLYLDKPQMDILNKAKTKAKQDKILITNEDSYAKAILFYKEAHDKAKVRFKGDWLDHLEGYKWSFRIALKGGKAWKGMRTFNIQTPFARGFLNEWFAHKIAEKEDILTTRYDFVPVFINHMNVGLFAYEEHFEKQLVENKNRREGPIIKLSEDQFWLGIKNDKLNMFSSFKSSKVLPFKKSRTLKDEKLASQFDLAKELLHAYKTKSAPVGEIFDVDKMAKYLAFIDFTRGYHGARWHNIRFYYNPVLSKLEPIAYDLFADERDTKSFSKALIGNVDIGGVKNGLNEVECSYVLFNDSIFREKYVEYITYFSDREFLDNALTEFGDELDYWEEKLQVEYPNYEFNREYFYNNQNGLKKELPVFLEKSAAYIKDMSEKSFLKREEFKPAEYEEDLAMELLQAYKEDDGYKLMNYMSKNVEIVGYIAAKSYSEMEGGSVTIPSFNNEPGIIKLDIEEEKVSEFEFKINGQEGTIRSSVLPWSSPERITLTNPEITWPEFVLEKDGQLYIPKGNYVIRENIVIPRFKNLNIEPGVNIDFSKGAYLWSNSAVNFRGTMEEPIIITSSDNSARGISIIQADDQSEVNYTTFTGFNTYLRESWNLTGAVTFYESDVNISNSSFRNNLCEDALNIVRSKFYITGCEFSEIFADAFDADFCTGIIEKSSFDMVGNDAIDFSGSQVEIRELMMSKVNDKGISGGEASTLKVYDCNITEVNIGVASKDKSLVEIENVTISNSEYGVVAYVKKKEYGPAVIRSKNSTYTEVKTIDLIEKESILYLNEVEISGKEKNLQKLFY